MTILQTIEAALKEVLEPVFYGTADDVNNSALWNYIVFFRNTASRSENNTSYTDRYTVALIHENWVPNELIDAVIEKMEAIKGMRMAKADVDFEYTRKPSTNAVIEVAVIPFIHARKKKV